MKPYLKSHKEYEERYDHIVFWLVTSDNVCMEDTDREPYVVLVVDAFKQAIVILGNLVVEQGHFTEKDQQLIQQLASCCNTGEAIGTLLDSDTTSSEAYMLMRTLLEKLVNFHYLRCAPESELERYSMYPYYRYYFSLKQKVYGHTMKAELNNPESKIEELKLLSPFKEALEMFSPTNPTLSWSNETFSKRVRFITEHEPVLEPVLVKSQMVTQTDASEMLHGSLWGIQLLSGVYHVNYEDPLNPTPEEVRRFYSQKIAIPLDALTELILLTIRIVATAAPELSSFSRVTDVSLQQLELHRHGIRELFSVHM